MRLSLLPSKFTGRARNQGAYSSVYSGTKNVLPKEFGKVSMSEPEAEPKASGLREIEAPPALADRTENPPTSDLRDGRCDKTSAAVCHHHQRSAGDPHHRRSPGGRRRRVRQEECRTYWRARGIGGNGVPGQSLHEIHSQQRQRGAVDGQRGSDRGRRAAVGHRRLPRIPEEAAPRWM